VLRSSRQTADTFQAAATFFELVNIWGLPDGEIQAKIKYAKWNAVRIAKALKEGKDPNESNPKPQLEEEKPMPPLDSNDIDQQQPSVLDTSRHATVQEIPDEQEILGEQGFPYEPKSPDEQVHFKGDIALPLLSSHEAPPNDRKDSVGGGFFPEIPTLQDGDSPSANAPLFNATEVGLPPPPSRPAAPQDYYRDSPGVQPSPSNIPHIPYPRPAAAQAPLLQSVAINTNTMDLDEEAIAQAQKHARWAISALNFEDTNTAIKELREALRTLGAEV
jgi:vacuolar protein sorting-associated protein VTA1